MMNMSSQGGGHLYMQTNEIRNCVVHYRRGADGAITEMERTATGGAGSGCPLTLQASSHRAWSDTRRIHTARPTVCPPWPYSRPTGSSSSSAPRHRANSLLANNDLQWPVDWMGSPAGDPEC